MSRVACGCEPRVATPRGSDVVGLIVAGFDVAVVGGGPAGLAAAQELLHSGATVAVIDENYEFGGQYYRRREAEFAARYGDYRPDGSELVTAIRAGAATCLTNTAVWGTENGYLWTSHSPTGTVARLQAKSVLLATGAHERVIPFPGWTLPGVCTPGLALHLAAMERVAVGRRVVLAGTGAFLLSVAASLIDVGVKPLAVLEYNKPYRARSDAFTAVRHFARMRELAGYFMKLRRHGVPIRQGWRIAEAGGNTQVESVTVERTVGNAERMELAVDALCVGFGFRPNVELARLLGCACSWDAVAGEAVVVTDAFGRTSIDGVYAAGEVRGIAGVQAAMVEGRLSARTILSDLGRKGIPSSDRILQKSQKLRRFATLMSNVYRLPDAAYVAIEDRTIVCRCESVTAEQIRGAARTGWNNINAVKSATRAGMGVCQGRLCATTVARLVVAEGSNRGLSDLYAADEFFNTRMPLKPVPVLDFLSGNPD